MLKFKKEATAADFCIGGAEDLIPLLEEAYSYRFDEAPNY
jgi:hypothetical protein